MPEMLTDLWPEIETENIVTPLAILRFQAGQLRTKTKGLIEAEVRTKTTSNGWACHDLVIIAPALDRYEFVIATFSHAMTMVYPVTVESQFIEGVSPYQESRSCNSQNGLITAISEILRSERMRAVITSLIAQSREAGPLTQ